MKEFIEELKYNQNINIEKGLENRVDIDYVIERLEGINKDIISKNDILKMYDLVFEDAVQCYIEGLNEDLEENEEARNITEEEKKEIAYKMIYKNEYVWEIINETIDTYINEIINNRDKEV